MELKELLKQYLPDDKAYISNFVLKENWIPYFPEAFENFKKDFADKICAEQRKNCWHDWAQSDLDFEGTAILHAEQPKIEEI